LFSCAPRRFGCFLGVVMDAQGKILVHDSHFVVVGLTYFGEFRLNSSAVRSLKIRELDNRDWGVRGPT
jgi:hypothetical protein